MKGSFFLALQSWCLVQLRFSGSFSPVVSYKVSCLPPNAPIFRGKVGRIVALYWNMKQILLFLLLGPVSSFSATDGEWREVLQEGSDSYVVTVKPKEKRVEVSAQAKEKNPHLRIRVYRKNDRPLDLRLQALEPKGQEVLYLGKYENLGRSTMGIQLQVSFDKKTWKNFGAKVKRALDSLAP